jgi:FkbM family methyltransferase
MNLIHVLSDGAEVCSERGCDEPDPMGMESRAGIMELPKLLRSLWSHPLNRSARLKALSRMVRWQIASRLLPESTFALPFVNDGHLLVRRGMTGATGNWYGGLDEANDMGLILHLLRPGDLFLDVGANVGSYSILAAVGTGARVIAVEPIAQAFSALVANIRVNGLESRVSAHPVGLSDRVGTLEFTVAQDSGNHVLADGEHAESAVIATTTIDALCGGAVPTAIKIDVEGQELRVLEGAKQTMAAPALLAVVIEMNGSGIRYGIDDREVDAWMGRIGFEAWRYSAIDRELVRHEASRDYVGNTLFLRDPNEARRRVRLAPKVRLVNGWL